MRRALPLSLLATALLAAAPAAQTVATLINNGTTETRYDIVILGDGYQLTEEAQFDSDVAAFLTSLFQKEPYLTFANYYNVHTVFRASQESGADRPDETPPIYRNTVYDATYNYGGTPRWRRRPKAACWSWSTTTATAAAPRPSP